MICCLLFESSAIFSSFLVNGVCVACNFSDCPMAVPLSQEHLMRRQVFSHLGWVGQIVLSSFSIASYRNI